MQPAQGAHCSSGHVLVPLLQVLRAGKDVLGVYRQRRHLSGPALRPGPDQTTLACSDSFTRVYDNDVYGTKTLVTQLENERSRVHATEVPATEPFHSQLSAIAFLFIQL